MTCENCKFFMGEPETDQAPCHRYPPQLIPVMADTMAGPKMAIQSVFPVVNKDWFCGEYQKKARGLVNADS